MGLLMMKEPRCSSVRFEIVLMALKKSPLGMEVAEAKGVTVLMTAKREAGIVNVNPNRDEETGREIVPEVVIVMRSVIIVIEAGKEMGAVVHIAILIGIGGK